MSNKDAVKYLFNSKIFILPAIMNDKNSKDIILSNLESIPAMTSRTTPSGEVKESVFETTGYEGWGAFSGFWTDENIKKYGTIVDYYNGNNRIWSTPNNATQYPSWLQYKFDNKKITPLVFEYISSYSWGNGCDHKIKIQGSNDEINWTDLTEEISCSAFTKYEFYPTKNITEYQYFRLNVLSRTETYGNRTDVLKFQVYGY